MKDHADAILRPAQASYLDGLLPRRDDLLGEMEAFAAAEGIPISDPEVGLMLQMLVGATGAERVLEVGSAIGYGTIWLARGGAETRVLAIEREADRIEQARAYLDRARVADRVRFVEGDALEVVRGLEPAFDLIYLDCDKRDYRRLLDFSLQLLRLGGLVVIDNLLWKGQVADPPEEDEEAEAEVLRMFNGYLSMHPQLDSLVLPMADGLGVAIKKKPLITDLGGPY